VSITKRTVQNKKSQTLVQAITRLFWKVPKAYRHTLTLDNERKFARLKEVQKTTGLTVYVADPTAAWQRRTNKNTNGLVRQFHPKRPDFSKVSDESFAISVQLINHRPRKCLDYQTPHEVFFREQSAAL